LYHYRLGWLECLSQAFLGIAKTSSSSYKYFIADILNIVQTITFAIVKLGFKEI